MSNPSTRRLDDAFFTELDRIETWLVEKDIRKPNRFHQYLKNIKWLMKHDSEQDRARIYAELKKQQGLT